MRSDYGSLPDMRKLILYYLRSGWLPVVVVIVALVMGAVIMLLSTAISYFFSIEHNNAVLKLLRGFGGVLSWISLFSLPMVLVAGLYQYKHNQRVSGAVNIFLGLALSLYFLIFILYLIFLAPRPI